MEDNSSVTISKWLRDLPCKNILTPIAVCSDITSNASSQMFMKIHTDSYDNMADGNSLMLVNVICKVESSILIATSKTKIYYIVQQN